METFSEDKKETVLNLITHVEVEPSHNSDAPTLIPAIKSLKEQKMMPEVVLADRLCGRDDNTQKADEMAVDIASPVMGGADDGIFQLFSLFENGHFASCPQGHIPVKTRKRKDRLAFISDSLSFFQSHPDFEFLRLHHLWGQFLWGIMPLIKIYWVK